MACEQETAKTILICLDVASFAAACHV